MHSLVNNRWCVVLDSAPFQYRKLYILSRVFFPVKYLENRGQSTILWFICRGFGLIGSWSELSVCLTHIVFITFFQGIKYTKSLNSLRWVLVSIVAVGSGMGTFLLCQILSPEE